jgi:hypothetical protein
VKGSKFMPASQRHMRPRKNVDMKGSRLRRLIRQSKPKELENDRNPACLAGHVVPMAGPGAGEPGPEV